MPDSNTPLIGLVGPCCAGKSTLMRALTALGYHARAIAQEHSYVPRMWQVITKPAVLIYLDVSYEEAQRRRWMNWQPADHAEQGRRLAHAHTHSHFYLHTDGLTPEAVRDAVVAFLQQQAVGFTPQPAPDS